MAFGGTRGAGPPQPARRRAQGGSAQGATAKQVTHVPTVAQRWQGMSQHNPFQSGGTPISIPVPPGCPSLLAFVRSGAGAPGEPWLR